MKFKIGMTAIRVNIKNYIIEGVNGGIKRKFSIQGLASRLFCLTSCLQYLTEDLSGNKASCVFYVRVLGK